MIVSSSLNSLHSAAQPVSQPLPLGRNSSQSADAYLQNSSIKPVESLESPVRTSIRSRERFVADEPAISDEEVKRDESRADSNREQAEVNKLRDRKARIEREHDKQQLLHEQRQVSELAVRDREVRAHEQAHASVGGQFAGAPSFQFERGPDGVSYAVSGEVSIDSGRAATPEATIQKAQTVRRSALAPANPSPQDRSVAASATRLESDARSEILAIRIADAEFARETAQAERKAEDQNGLADDAEDKADETESPNGLSDEITGEKAASQISSLASNASVEKILAVANADSQRVGSVVSQTV